MIQIHLIFKKLTNLTWVFLDSRQNVRKMCKKRIFHQNYIVRYNFSNSVHSSPTTRCLKGQCLEIFFFWFLSWISFPPAPEYPIKGTVRPDWICMRVVPLESPLKGHQPLYVFDFLISILNIWNNFKVLSRFMQNLTQPPACSDHRLHSILSSHWLAHCYLMKKFTSL